MLLLRSICAFFLLLNLIACVSIQINELPNITDKNEIVEIIIKRKPILLGAALKHYFTIDGKVVVALRPGEQFTFTIDPGKYIFGVMLATGANHSIPVTLIARQKYLFYTAAVLDGVVLQLQIISHPPP
jgi:hypothetical protein